MKTSDRYHKFNTIYHPDESEIGGCSIRKRTVTRHSKSKIELEFNKI